MSRYNSDNDQRLLTEAMERAGKEQDKFMNYFGIRGEVRDLCAKECEVFIADAIEAEKELGRHSFFNAPLARRAFMVGYFRGRATVSTMEASSGEKPAPESGEVRE